MRKTSQLSNLRRRVAVTLLTLLVYMLGSSIPVPFARFTKSFHHLLTNTPLSVVSFMSGANFQKLSLFMIGLNPLMIAMLIMQLLMMMRFFNDNLHEPQFTAPQNIFAENQVKEMTQTILTALLKPALMKKLIDTQREYANDSTIEQYQEVIGVLTNGKAR